MSSTVVHLGTTDEITTCDCCGKANLKMTVALSFGIDGDVRHYGTSCAARAASMQVKDIKAGARAADLAQESAARKIAQEKHTAEMAAWSAWLAANAPSGHDIFTRIHALGGMAAARALRASQAAA